MTNTSTLTLIKYIILTIYILFLSFYIYYLKKNKAIHMNAEPLTRQNLFTAALVIPFISFTTFGTFAWLGHTLQLDAEGLNNFLNISKLPLALLSLSVPFGVIVSNIHRTIQTDMQIKEAQKKNKIDAFYAHRKNTVELFDNLNFPTLTILDIDVNMKLANSYAFYKWVYPKASIASDDYTPSRQILQETKFTWLSIAKILNIKNKLPLESQAYNYSKIELILEDFHYHIGFERHTNNELYSLNFRNKDSDLCELTSKYRNEHQLRNAIISYWNSYCLLASSVEIEFDNDFSEKTMAIINYFLGEITMFEHINLEDLIAGVTPSLSKKNFLNVH